MEWFGMVWKGVVWGITRGAAELTDDDYLREVSKGFALDPMDINPLRNATNIIRHTVALIDKQVYLMQK